MVLAQINKIKQDLVGHDNLINGCMREINRVEIQLKETTHVDPEKALDKMRKRLIDQVFNEKFNPIKMNISLDLKTLKK